MVAEFFVSGQLSGLLDERRSQRMIDSHSDHVLVCGFAGCSGISLGLGSAMSRSSDEIDVPQLERRFKSTPELCA